MNSAEYNQLKALIEQLNAKVDILYQQSLDQAQISELQPVRPVIQTPTKLRDMDEEFAFDMPPVSFNEALAQDAVDRETIPHEVIAPQEVVPEPQLLPEPCLAEVTPLPVMTPAQNPTVAKTPTRTRPQRAQATPVSTVGDLFATMAQVPTVAEVLVQKRERKPLNESISTNDRYLFVKVLFNWDESLYIQTIAAMEKMASMRMVEDYLAKHFPAWEVTSPAVHRFLHQMEEYVR